MQLLTIPEAAARLGVSRGHIYNLVAAGQLDRYNVALKGSKIRISDESVDRYIAQAAQPVRDGAA